MCTNSPVSGMYLSFLFACTSCLPVFHHQGYRMISGRRVSHNMLQNIASVDHWNPRVVESYSQETRLDLASTWFGFWRRIFSSSNPHSLLQVLEMFMFRCNFYWDRPCFWIPSMNSETYRFTQMTASFSFCFSGAIESPSFEVLFSQTMLWRILSQDQHVAGRRTHCTLMGQIFPFEGKTGLTDCLEKTKFQKSSMIKGLKGAFSLVLYLHEKQNFPLTIFWGYFTLPCAACLEQWITLAEHTGSGRAPEGGPPASSHRGQECYLRIFC